MIYECDVLDICELSDFDVFTTLLSAAAHDMDHPGTNNFLEINCKSKLALLYNDQSVLENHHAASYFFLLDNSKHDCNVLKNFTTAEIKELRRATIDNILCTDNSNHAQIYNEMKTLSETIPSD